MARERPVDRLGGNVKIGDKFVVDYALSRFTETRKKGEIKNDWRGWEKDKFYSPKEVWLIGLRTKQEGWYEPERYSPDSWYGGEEYDGPYLDAKNFLRCALVTDSIYKVGWFVLVEDLKEVETNQQRQQTTGVSLMDIPA